MLKPGTELVVVNLAERGLTLGKALSQLRSYGKQKIWERAGMIAKDGRVLATIDLENGELRMYYHDAAGPGPVGVGEA